MPFFLPTPSRASVISRRFPKSLSPLPPLWLRVHWSTMSAQICRVVELFMRSACCHTIRRRSCLRKAVLAPVAPSGLCVPGAPLLHRRAYSLDALSLGPGRPTLGSSSQQQSADRTSPSSSLTHRNLSAVAVQVGSYLWLLLYCKHQSSSAAWHMSLLLYLYTIINSHVLKRN